MDDYISRHEAIQSLESVTLDPGCPLFIAAEIDQILEFIPAADVRPERHGVWLPLETTNGKYGKKVFECSECKTFHFPSEFCPKCGALMDADKKDIGTHDEAVGFAPNGDWCGECSKISCINCSVWQRMKATEDKTEEGENGHSTDNAKTS